MLICLAAIWGASFLFIRMAVGDFGAIPLTATRSAIAALTLTPLMLWSGKGHLFLKYWTHLLVLSLISTALPFVFLSISTQYTSAGFASILNALTPIFSAIIAWLWLKEYLSMPAMIGIASSFAGVLVMVLDKDTIDASFALLPILAGLAATFMYGLTGNYSRKLLPGLSPLVVSAGCQIFSALCLAPFAYLQWPSEPIPARGWILASVLGIVCTGAAFIIYFHLLEKIGVARTVVVTYLSPVFAMVWGYLFLEEVITLKMFIGAICIMIGIGLTTRSPGSAKTAGVIVDKKS
jgi:drug/metabolite transporter (DMT)-like permease